MSETKTIDEISARISEDIFQHFFWTQHSRKEVNFKCVNADHKSSNGNPKETHPADALFSYCDPYLGKTIYLHTDLKSYKKESIKPSKVRDALRSLCMTVDCARSSADWRKKFSIDESDPYEIRGFLFVHNHDHRYIESFENAVNSIDISALPVVANTQIHFLGPGDINRLYSIANDLIRLKYKKVLSEDYAFFYPDLVIGRRKTDIFRQAATIESLTSPYFAIKQNAVEGIEACYVVYYNAPAKDADEFLYFIDILSRFQLLNSGVKLYVRITARDASDDLMSLFDSAKKRYAHAWGFGESQIRVLNEIEIDRIACVADMYTPGDMGWDR